MGSSRTLIELEEQLKEAGNMLLSPPSPVDEVITLLDKVERLLAIVEQAPSRSMQDALLPVMKTLIENELLRHPDMNVRLSVASCISEITRITAPEAPYDDELMKEIFRLTVVAFEKLSDASGRCYSKAISILDTVAKVRSCLLMLDLECDTLIIEMFQRFLKLIRSNHPHVVLLSMEAIMTLVIDESEDVSWDLLNILLASVRKENQDVSPMSYKLGEKVITNCAAKLKKSLMIAVQSGGIALDEYAHIVAYICKSGYETLQDSRLSSAVYELATKEPESLCLGEVCHDVNGISNSVMSNGNASSRNDDSALKDKSSKVLEQCSNVDHYVNHVESLDAKCNSGPGDLDSLRTVKSKIELESAPKKRGRKPNSLLNPEEGYDHSWICIGRKTSTVLGRRKSLDKGADCLPSTDQDSKKGLLSTQQKVGDPTFASLKSGLPDVNHQRRGQEKKRGSAMNQEADPNSLSMSLSTHVKEKASPSTDLSFGKGLEDRYNTEIKRRKGSKTNEVTTYSLQDGVSEKDVEVPGYHKEKPQKLSLIKVRQRSINDDGSSIQAGIKKSSLVAAISAKGITETSAAKKKKISKDAVNSSVRNRNWSEDTPKTEVKKKLTGRKEENNKISKAAIKSLNEERNCSGDTPKTEVKKKHSPRKEEKKKISKAAVKSSNRDGNFLEDVLKIEVKKKRTAEKGEKKMTSKASMKSSHRDGNSSEDTPKTDVKKKHTARKEERKTSLNAAVKLSNRGGKETPKTGVKRKHTAGKEEASGTPLFGEQLVGSKIKVWWPMDKMFYEGVVDSYDNIKRKHRVLYADGDEETLNLKRQRWELVEVCILSEKEQEMEVVKPNASSDTLPKVKEETKFEHVEDGKTSSLKRNTPSACASIRKAKKSVGNSSASATLEKHLNAEELNVDVSKKDSSPKGDGQNSATKLRLKNRKLIFTLSKPQQTVTTSNVESPKGSHCESPGVGRSTGEQTDNPGETNKEAKKGITSKDAEMNVDGEKGVTYNDVEAEVDGGKKGIASNNVETNVDGEKGIASINVETNVDGEKGITSDNVETNVDGREKGIASKDIETNMYGGERGISLNNVETNVDGEKTERGT